MRRYLQRRRAAADHDGENPLEEQAKSRRKGNLVDAVRGILPRRLRDVFPSAPASVSGPRRIKSVLILTIVAMTLLGMLSAARWAHSSFSFSEREEAVRQQAASEVKRVARRQELEDRLGRVYEATSALAPCDFFGMSTLSAVPSGLLEKHPGWDAEGGVRASQLRDAALDELDTLLTESGSSIPLSASLRRVLEEERRTAVDLQTNPLSMCRHFIHLHHVSIGDETVVGGRFRPPPPSHLYDVGPRTTEADAAPIQPGVDGGVKAIIPEPNDNQRVDDATVAGAANGGVVDGKKPPWYALGLVSKDLSPSTNPQVELLEKIAPVAPVVVEHAAHLLGSPGAINLNKRSASSKRAGSNGDASNISATKMGVLSEKQSSIVHLLVPPFQGELTRIHRMGVAAYLLHGDSNRGPPPSQASGGDTAAPSAGGESGGGMESVFVAMIGKSIVNLWNDVATRFHTRQGEGHLPPTSPLRPERADSGLLPPRHHHQYLASFTTHTIELPWHTTGRVLFRVKRDHLPYFHVSVHDYASGTGGVADNQSLPSRPTVAIPNVEPVEHWLVRNGEPGTHQMMSKKRSSELRSQVSKLMIPSDVENPTFGSNFLPSPSVLAPFYPEHPYQHALMDPSQWLDDYTAKRGHFFGSSHFQNFGDAVDIIREALIKQDELLRGIQINNPLHHGVKATSTTAAPSPTEEVLAAGSNTSSDHPWLSLLTPHPITSPFLFSFEQFNTRFWASYPSVSLPYWVPQRARLGGFQSGGFASQTGVIPYCSPDGGGEAWSEDSVVDEALQRVGLRGEKTAVIEIVSTELIETITAKVRSALHAHRLHVASLQARHVLDPRAHNRISESGVQGTLPLLQMRARSHVSLENSMYANVFTITENVAGGKRKDTKGASGSKPNSLPSVSIKPLPPNLGGWDKVRRAIFTVFDSKVKVWADQLAQYVVDATTAADELMPILAVLSRRPGQPLPRLSPSEKGALSVSLNQFIAKQLSPKRTDSSFSGGSPPSSSSSHQSSNSQHAASSNTMIVHTLNHFVITCSVSAGLHDALRERYFFEAFPTTAPLPRARLAEERLARIHSHCMGFFLDRLRVMAETDAPRHVFSYLANIMDAPQSGIKIPTYPATERWALGRRIVSAGVTTGALSGDFTAGRFTEARQLVTADQVSAGIKDGSIQPSYVEQQSVLYAMHADVLRAKSGLKLTEKGTVQFEQVADSGVHVSSRVEQKGQAAKAASPREEGEARQWMVDFEKSLMRLRKRAHLSFVERLPMLVTYLDQQQRLYSSNASEGMGDSDVVLNSLSGREDALEEAANNKIHGQRGSSEEQTFWGSVKAFFTIGGSRQGPSGREAAADRRALFKKKIELALRSEEAVEGRPNLLTPSQRDLLVRHYSIPVHYANNKKGAPIHTTLTEEEILQRVARFLHRHMIRIRFGVPGLFYRGGVGGASKGGDGVESTKNSAYERWLAEKLGIRVHVVAMPAGPSGAKFSPSSDLMKFVVGPAMEASGYNIYGPGGGETDTKPINKEGGNGGDHRQEAITTRDETQVEGVSSKRKLLQDEGGEGGHRNLPPADDPNVFMGGIDQPATTSDPENASPDEIRARREALAHISLEHHEVSQYLREVGASMPYCGMQDSLSEELSTVLHPGSTSIKAADAHAWARLKERHMPLWRRVEEFMRSLGGADGSLAARIADRVDSDLRTSPMTWGVPPTNAAAAATTPYTHFRLFGAPVSVSVVAAASSRSVEATDASPLISRCLSPLSQFETIFRASANKTQLGFSPDYNPDERYRALRRNVLDTSEWLWSDCIHPSQAGHRVIALTTLQQLLETVTGVVEKGSTGIP